MIPRRPGKRPQGGPTREPLSYLFGTRAKVSCVRVMCAAGDPITQREVARRAGVQHRSAQLALDELVAVGLVSRIEGGRDFLVRLNDEHHLGSAVRSLFNAEAAQFLELRRRLVEIATGGARVREIRSAVLFGSVARGDDRPDSDLDLLLIVADAGARERLLERFYAAVPHLHARFGCRVRPLAYTLAESRRCWRAHEPPLPDVARDGLVLFGPPLPDLLGG
ncbi:MAG: nucleotidyltransferase domain-containing protein [Gemmatimonadales bacterium]